VVVWTLTGSLGPCWHTETTLIQKQDFLLPRSFLVENSATTSLLLSIAISLGKNGDWRLICENVLWPKGMVVCRRSFSRVHALCPLSAVVTLWYCRTCKPTMVNLADGQKAERLLKFYLMMLTW